MRSRALSGWGRLPSTGTADRGSSPVRRRGIRTVYLIGLIALVLEIVSGCGVR
ncbi:MAG: hypothetical protein IRZ20_03400 [Thermoleophilia bacterium]|nr:hypothetical protein [Thermoleophilia bacterium]